MVASESNKVSVEIPHGLVELTQTFATPTVEAWANLRTLIQRVLLDLGPFGFALDGVDSRLTANRPSEHSILFKRLNPNITFLLSYSKLVMSAENLSWEQKAEAVTTFNTGVDAISAVMHSVVAAQQLIMNIHVQSKTKPVAEIVQPLLSQTGSSLLDGPLSFSGVVLKSPQVMVVVDLSLVFANSLFVRITRDHAKDTTIAEMAETLHADEQRIFDVLGLEGEL